MSLPRNSACKLIDQKVVELGDWRGKTLTKVRKLIKDADPDIVALNASAAKAKQKRTK